MPKLNKYDLQLRLKRGVAADLPAMDTNLLGVQGEPAYTTDTKRLYMHDGSIFQPVQTLEMALTHDGDVLTYQGDVLYA